MNDDVHSILNDLIETSLDGEKGFAKAAEDAESANLKSTFTQCAQSCREGARELQSKVRAGGGNPDQHGSASAALHRGWISLREAVTGRDDLAILEECERGQDHAKSQYRNALDKDLPAEVRAIVERQYQGVIANHDLVRDLRDRQRQTVK